MLFNSFPFLFAFLPATLLVFFALGRRGARRGAIAWLVLVSLLYYGWWEPAYVPLLAASVVANYALGRVLAGGAGPHDPRRAWLAIGIVANLGLLGYFKYANFFLDNLNRVAGTELHLQALLLPLGISFFTFQQIAYLVDAHRGEAREYRFLHYCLFVTFFPQLIAGPIVHHKEMLPQFESPRIYRFDPAGFSRGLAIFVLGLFKKVVLADGVARLATPVFGAADAGVAPGFTEAWIGALAYTFQLYFDFSGYTDMALGLARMLGVRLPLNFASPYQAVSIIDFWRRWHMTLSRFLRDYVYIPLGGNRRGVSRRYVNLMLTMLVGGLWHGAAWTFVVWGGLHGVFLVVAHGWRWLRRRVLGRDLERSGAAGRLAGRLLTFLCVVVGWVLFRAESFEGARSILAAMAGAGGLPAEPPPLESVLVLAGLWLLVWLAPNSQTFIGLEPQPPSPAGQRLRFAPSVAWGVAMAALFLVSVFHLAEVSEFLYFNF